MKIKIGMLTVRDNRLKVNFCIAVPAVELHAPAASKQLLPALNWSNWGINKIELNGINQPITFYQVDWPVHLNTGFASKLFSAEIRVVWRVDVVPDMILLMVTRLTIKIIN